MMAPEGWLPPAPIDIDEQIKGAPVSTKIADRAGSHLNHAQSRVIMGPAKKGGNHPHGLFDESQSLYQAGGEMGDFVYWKLKLVSLSSDVFRQITRADTIEIIDHKKNECWRIPMARFTAHQQSYNAGIGDRIGCPIEHWDVVAYDGTVRQAGVP